MASPTGPQYEPLYVPGFTDPTQTYGKQIGDQFSAQLVFELLASTTGFVQYGVVLAAGQGVIPTGCVIAQQTANKKYYVYNPAASDGTQIPRGVLRLAKDTGTSAAGTSADQLGNIVKAGTLNYTYMSGVDTNVINVLNARVDTDFNIFQF